jgi:siroheme synthase-like protein
MSTSEDRVEKDPAGQPGAPLWPVFLKLAGRRVLVVGGGQVAAVRVRELIKAGARPTVVAPRVAAEIAMTEGVAVAEREFEAADLDGVWLAVAAASPEVNRQVAAAAEARRVFVNAVDDVQSGSAYTAGVIRKGGVTIAVSTEGRAPALAGLLREGIEALLPEDVDVWVEEAHRLRVEQRAGRVPMAERRPRLLAVLNRIYAERGAAPSPSGT